LVGRMLAGNSSREKIIQNTTDPEFPGGGLVALMRWKTALLFLLFSKKKH